MRIKRLAKFISIAWRNRSKREGAPWRIYVGITWRVATVSTRYAATETWRTEGRLLDDKRLSNSLAHYAGEEREWECIDHVAILEK